MAITRQRVASALAIVFAGAVLFVVASAYVVSRDQPAWFAAAIGALAFPIGPVAWHVVGERKRKARLAAAKKQPKSSLSAIDRYWLRAVAAAVVVIGPMIALGGFDVARATWNHGLWWVPSGGSSSSSSNAVATELSVGAEKMLRRVPIDAELVVVMHKDKTDKEPGGDALLAWGNRQLVVVADKALRDKDEMDKGVDSLNGMREKVPLVPFDKVAEIKLDGDTIGVVSDGWRAHVDVGGAGPSPDVRRELGRAPKDASLVAAFVPRTLRDVPVRGGVAWLRADTAKERIVLEARVEAIDVDAAKKLATAAKSAKDLIDRAPEGCRKPLREIADSLEVTQDGAIVTAKLVVAGEHMLPLVFCATK
jgi:hypothetical protein